MASKQARSYLDHCKFVLFAIGCGLFSVPLFADERTVHEAEFKGKYESFDVKMERKLIDLGNGKFELRAKAKNFFASITESETFYWRQNQILPIEYHYKQRIFGVKKDRGTRFDWENNVAIFQKGDDRTTVQLSEGILGPMSYQLQLQIDVANGKPELVYDFIKRGKIKNYQFRHVKDEVLDREGLEQAVLVRRSDDGGEKQTDVWLNSTKSFSLAGISHTDDGDTNSMWMVSEKSMPPFANTPQALLKKSAK